MNDKTIEQLFDEIMRQKKLLENKLHAAEARIKSEDNTQDLEIQRLHNHIDSLRRRNTDLQKQIQSLNLQLEEYKKKIERAKSWVS